jgi:hypothetical protein
MSAEHTHWEFRKNGSDGGLDACFCLKGQPREYGHIDVFDGGETTQKVLRAVNNHDALVKALQLCVFSLHDLASAYPNDATFDGGNEGYAFEAAKQAREALEKAILNHDV